MSSAAVAPSVTSIIPSSGVSQLAQLLFVTAKLSAAHTHARGIEERRAEDSREKQWSGEEEERRGRAEGEASRVQSSDEMQHHLRPSLLANSIDRSSHVCHRCVYWCVIKLCSASDQQRGEACAQTISDPSHTHSTHMQTRRVNTALSRSSFTDAAAISGLCSLVCV